MILKLKNTNVMKISDIDINNILVSIKLPFGKQDFRFLATKMIKILELYAYSFQQR